MPLAPVPLFAPVKAARVGWPPFSVVLTLWLSMLPALGVGARPARTRSRSRSAVWMRSQSPLSRHARH
jgi:hypothetical protein